MSIRTTSSANCFIDHRPDPSPCSLVGLLLGCGGLGVCRTRMKIATFNVNSLRKRLPIVLDWLARQKPDVLCLQETKVQDSEFPLLALAES